MLHCQDPALSVLPLRRGTPCCRTPRAFPTSCLESQSDPPEALGDGGGASPSTLPGDVTSWETGCGRRRSRQRNPGSCSSSAAPRGPCASPPRPGADTPPPSAGAGGSAPAGRSVLSCQQSGTGYRPPTRGRTPAPAPLWPLLLAPGAPRRSRAPSCTNPGGEGIQPPRWTPAQPQTAVKTSRLCGTGSVPQLTAGSRAPGASGPHR